MNYLIYFPDDYDGNSDKKWPLLIFLHGVGETGTDVNKLKSIGLAKNIEEGHQYPFIIISPQEQDQGTGWNIQSLYSFYQKIIEKYPVDKDRVYLTGLSMGGFGTWNFAIMYPEIFAAIIPICGGTHYHDMLKRIKKLPVWCFHGDADGVVPISESQKSVDELKANGGNVKFTVYPGVGHDSWTQTYLNQEIYDWLLQQKREKNKPIELNNEILSRYIGTYRSKETNNYIHFEVVDKDLVMRINDGEENVLNAVSENEFYKNEYVKNYITFSKDIDGKTTGVTFWDLYFTKE